MIGCMSLEEAVDDSSLLLPKSHVLAVISYTTEVGMFAWIRGLEDAERLLLGLERPLRALSS